MNTVTASGFWLFLLQLCLLPCRISGSLCFCLSSRHPIINKNHTRIFFLMNCLAVSSPVECHPDLSISIMDSLLFYTYSSPLHTVYPSTWCSEVIGLQSQTNMGFNLTLSVTGLLLANCLMSLDMELFHWPYKHHLSHKDCEMATMLLCVKHLAQHEERTQ